MNLKQALKSALSDISVFSEHLSGVKLRDYQKAVAYAIVDSVVRKKGLSFVVIFPRQSGKNELQAQIETYLLALFSNTPAEIVKVSPTWKPQSLNAMRRLERIVSRNLITRNRWSKEQGYIYRVGDARCFFLSADPSASIVGATASLLLECDEAQDVLISKYDKEIAPMAASTNATRVFWGTSWTSQTLLAREEAAALQAEKQDGIRRVFRITANEVRKEVKTYGAFVDAEIAKLGRNHPSIRTQFFSETIDESAGLFTPARLMLMAGSHTPQDAPQPGEVYLFTLDVGGEETNSPSPTGKGLGDGDSTHDSTALTIFSVDTSTLLDPGLQAPTFRVVGRRQWTGIGQPELYGQLNALADLWQPYRIVIDATGLGEGLAAFLARSHGSRLVRFKFTQSSKSELGWAFLGIVESGRFKDHNHFEDPLHTEFYLQARYTLAEILPGPARTLRYSVPEGTRDPATGKRLHDDLVLSAMLCAALPAETFGRAESTVIPAVDPLDALKF